ncbi:MULTISPECIES: hypothetical protein [Streptomyces]|uniref:LPXTG cell wall anchor domain-containing protein n=1 Tax=Streptomyces sudanensis TaxID=436397 RepID=A0ABY4TA52_9ACTN|nr:MULTISPECIES: hypothetical protein [Streptomyces]MCP9986693.1 hypothetical protein [Streptomyces sudanensis]URN15251.1 hypothetical protein MW084_04040 [Streptomyces sudanensis]
MSVARRPLLTATAAGTLLGALWFVPSANATGEEPTAPRTGGAAAALHTGTAADAHRTPRSAAGQELRLADTGAGADTVPYALGGSALLAAGVGLVAFAVRRGAHAPS